jgi:hypothetical protein
MTIDPDSKLNEWAEKSEVEKEVLKNRRDKKQLKQNEL